MATRVLIMSDTHGKVSEKIIRCIAGVDIVIHAGDFDDWRTFDRISTASKMLLSVRGNCDWASWGKALPVSRTFAIEDVKFFMKHDPSEIGYVPQEIDVVIFGHTHVPYDHVDDGIRFLSPGSCTRGRNLSGEHFILMTVDGKRITTELVEAEDGPL